MKRVRLHRHGHGCRFTQSPAGLRGYYLTWTEVACGGIHCLDQIKSGALFRRFTAAIDASRGISSASSSCELAIGHR
jgi:hypothetical protein